MACLTELGIATPCLLVLTRLVEFEAGGLYVLVLLVVTVSTCLSPAAILVSALILVSVAGCSATKSSVCADLSAARTTRTRVETRKKAAMAPSLVILMCFDVPSLSIASQMLLVRLAHDVFTFFGLAVKAGCGIVLI
jgi:hypothetical protein